MRGASDLCTERLNVLDPRFVLLDAIGRETNDLHATGRKVAGATSDFTKLGGANRGKVIWEWTSIISPRSASQRISLPGWEKRIACVRDKDGRVSVI